MPRVSGWMKAIAELPCALHEIREAIGGLRELVQEVQAEQRKIHRALDTLVAKEAHEEHVLAAIQTALAGVDLPPGKLEAVNTILQANLAKLRGAIASATPTPPK